MKNAKKTLAMLLALCMVVALCACGQTAAPAPAAPAAPAAEAPAAEAPAAEAPAADAPKVGQTVLKCAFNQSIDNPEARTLLWISDELFDATEGRYSIEVYPNEGLGDQASSLETLMAGGIEMALVANSIIENYSPDFAIIGTPYVYDSLEHQEKVFESGKLADLYATTEEHGFKVLCAYSLGARNLYTRDKPVTTPEELAGMKIRVMGSQTCVDMLNAMGGVGITMGQGDVYSAIQTKTLDGAENNIITYTDLLQYEVAPYYNYSGHLMVPDELVINSAFLATMSEADQAALLDICQKSQPVCFKNCGDLRASYEQKAKDMGVTFSECDVAAFQELCQPVIAAKAEISELTQAVYAAILECR